MGWPTISRKAPFLAAAAIACAAAAPLGAATGHAAADSPAGLNRDDRDQIRRALGGALPPFVHEASLFGHGDPAGEPYSWAGASVSVSGDTAVVGAHHESGAAGYVGAAHVFVRSGGSWTEQQRLVAPDGNDNQVEPDAFGSAVAISGDTLVVGAPYHDGFSLHGAAYVYVRTAGVWNLQQEIAASDGSYHYFFGSAVSISGDTLVVGAPGVDIYAPTQLYDVGAAYVFARAGSVWGEQQKLFASDAAPGDEFGHSVSISGDTLVVGAHLADTPAGADAGAAYAFVRTGVLWTQQQKLTPPDGASSAEFGNAVAVEADTAVVGAHAADTPSGSGAGAAYVFVRSGTAWGQEQKLTPSDGAASLGFGDSASISGDTVAIGAIAASGGQGAAYAFVRSGSAWSEQQKLSASDAAPGAGFGWSASVSGDTLIVGAPKAGISESGLGYAFVRTADVWAEEQKLTMMGNSAWDDFGADVALDGDTLVVGAFADDTTAGVQGGSAYVFVRSGATWSEQQKLVPSDGGEDDLFGISVAISGDTLVVGTVHGGGPYIFVRSGGTWTQQQKLAAPSDWFGSLMSISGDTLVVADSNASLAHVFVRSGTTWTEEQLLPVEVAGAVALSGDTLAVQSAVFGDPSVQVFVRSGTIWTEQQELVPGDGNTSFGGPLSLSGDSLAIGGAGSGSTGFVYVFVRSGATWTKQQRLEGALYDDGFGSGVALIGDTLIVGAPWGGVSTPPGPGSAYVFVRSGGVWTLHQEIKTPNPAVWGFGVVSFSGDTVAVGAVYTDTPEGPLAGSAEVFRIEQADVSIAKTDGQDSAVPGEPVSYTITLGNVGPTLATEVAVTDTVPPILLDPSWTCTASPGSGCASGGAGNLGDLATVLVGGSVTYTLNATVDPDATGTLSNTATVSLPPGVDANPSNDSSTDTDSLTPEGDLWVTTTDDSGIAIPGGMVAYTITAANAGPSTLVDARVADPVPPELLGAAWTCSASAGSSCAAGGSGDIDDTVTLRPGGAATYTFWGGVDAAATGSLVNTASIVPPAGVPDPDMTNNSDSDVDTLLPGVSVASELTHGYRRRHVLAPSVAPTDLFRIRQRRHASYEVLLDAASGDLGSGAGPLLERVASDAATPVQDSTPIGPGGGRSLRWMNGLDTPVADEFVRVRSDGCTTDCDAADAYWIGALETTGLIPRFNNSGTQTTLLVLQNLGDEALDVDVRFWSPSGADLGGPPTLNLGPKASFLLDTSTVAPGTGGSITVANTGRYGLLAGKAVALEPATGFTFDTMLQLRSR